MITSFTNKTFLEWVESRAGKCLVAGPCSVETEEQVLQTALVLKSCGVSLLRGGIWKPRTRPNCFEGLGAIALPWLKAAGRAIAVPVATEVACAAHVEACLKSGIDVLWIGARTTTSPIAIQEIADSLAGVDVPVLVKNPMNPDLELWIGALDRIQRAGVKRVVAVHRGFSTHIPSKYRNRPLWSVALDMRRRMPHIPILCDPSHMSGTRKYIASLSSTALALGFDGLMIESHIAPEKALSDAQQQLTPLQLSSLLDGLPGIATDPQREVMPLAIELSEIEEDMAALEERRHRLLKSLQPEMREYDKSLTERSSQRSQTSAPLEVMS